ncbi:hypothetical protein CRUP_016816 [Coryphaenoides rupestris]|nr:hypothetical protein CRUP_016816 [Coryphaenoides rupestris]
MASPEPQQADAEGPPAVLCESSCPLDFTQLSPSKFGISSKSFAQSLPSSNRKDRAHRVRRRSTIGARGSPETNALIRFMAQQRAKTPPVALRTPEAAMSSPFLPRVSSALKEKMAVFQNLMMVDEGEGCDPVDGHKQSDGSLDGDKENCPSPTMSKRRRVGPSGPCEAEISGAGSPILQPWSTAADPEETSIELQSSREPGPVDVAAQCAVPLPASSSSIPALLEMEPFAMEAPSTAKKHKKRVRFGGPLSPEFFDKNLPPSTPLQKGTTPRRTQTPGAVPGLRSLLKTPQRGDGWSPLPQLLSLSPSLLGGSPTLTFPRQLPERNCEKIAFPSMEEADSPSLMDTGAWLAQPLDLNSAFQEESLAESPSGAAATGGPQAEPSLDPQAEPSLDPQAEPSLDPQAEPCHDPQAAPEEPVQPQPVEPGADPEPAVDTPTSSRPPRRKARSGAESSSSTAPVRVVSRKRKQPQQSEPVKRSLCAAAKSASRKTRGRSKWGSKEVDRSLYGSRDYASKGPGLSPITEGLGGPSPALQPPPSGKDVGEDPAPLSPPDPEDAVYSPPVPEEVNRAVPPLQREDATQHAGSDLSDLSGEPESHISPPAEPCPPPHVEVVHGVSHPEEEEEEEEEETTTGAALTEREAQAEDLAPWQTDFTLEDVFKPVATRGQRSVRRSLRNRGNGGEDSGLAWLPHTSPESLRATRRRSRAHSTPGPRTRTRSQRLNSTPTPRRTGRGPNTAPSQPPHDEQ